MLSSYLVIIVSIFLLVILLASVLFLLTQKLYWKLKEDKIKALKNEYEPEVAKFLLSEEEDFVMPSLPTQRDYLLFEEILLRECEGINEDLRLKLSHCFEKAGYVDLEINLLENGRKVWQRVQAANRLGVMKCRNAINPLINALEEDPSEEVKFAAARALGQIGDARGVRPLIKMLSEPTRWHTLKIIEIISLIRQEAVKPLIDILPEVEPDVKLIIIEILGEIKAYMGIKKLITLLDDPHDEVRVKAVKTIGVIGDVWAGDYLLNALDDSYWPVRALAAKGLGRLKYTKAIPKLCQTISDEEWWVRINSGEALKNLGKDGEEALFKLLNSTQDSVSEIARQMLEEKGLLSANNKVKNKGQELAASR